MLSITNELQDGIGGKSHDLSDTENQRRSVYARVSRLELDSMLQMFDFPDPNVHAATRSETTTPLQKLFAMNSQFMVDRAEQFVARLSIEIPDKTGDQLSRIRRAFELAYARQPSHEEVVIAKSFLKSDAHWSSFAQAMLASNEMMYID
jgi:hypothetical protein